MARKTDDCHLDADIFSGTLSSLHELIKVTAVLRKKKTLPLDITMATANLHSYPFIINHRPFWLGPVRTANSSLREFFHFNQNSSYILNYHNHIHFRRVSICLIRSFSPCCLPVSGSIWLKCLRCKTGISQFDRLAILNAYFNRFTLGIHLVQLSPRPVVVVDQKILRLIADYAAQTHSRFNTAIQSFLTAYFYKISELQDPVHYRKTTGKQRNN